MEAKDKAKELVNKFKLEPIKPFCIMHTEHIKQSALIAVDEILNIDNIKPYILHKEIIKYYVEVKKEINKL